MQSISGASSRSVRKPQIFIFRAFRRVPFIVIYCTVLGNPLAAWHHLFRGQRNAAFIQPLHVAPNLHDAPPVASAADCAHGIFDALHVSFPACCVFLRLIPFFRTYHSAKNPSKQREPCRRYKKQAAQTRSASKTIFIPLIPPAPGPHGRFSAASPGFVC